MSKHIGGNLIVVQATIDGVPAPGQYRIENETRDIDGKWDDIYVHVSGYFGAAGPHVFAAAPELLEALEQTQILLESLGLQSSDEYQANAAAIAKAKGEQ